MGDLMPAEAFAPGTYLQEMLDGRGWTQAEFAEIIGRPVKTVNQIINGKAAITPTTAKEFGVALGTSAMLWLNLEASFQLHHAPEPAAPRIARHARLRGRYPVREMVNRGWIAASSDPDVLEQQVLRFFGVGDLEATPSLAHAAKKTGYPEDLNGAQLAWLFRVRQIAGAMTVPPYSEKRLREAIPALADLLLSPEEVRHVPRVLAECGVRFVVVEHVPSSKIDGVCFWLDRKPAAPVIGMSLRRDKIDNFWFVLRHEIEHVLQKHGRDVAIIDSDMTEPGADGIPAVVPSEEERLANAAAAEFCVPAAELDDFILRTRPLFSEQKVTNFAHRLRVHPGLVVGQLQRRLGHWRLLGHQLVKVRHLIAPVAMTDGYGQTLPLTP